MIQAAVRCGAVQYGVVQSGAARYDAVRCSALSAMRCGAPALAADRNHESKDAACHTACCHSISLGRFKIITELYRFKPSDPSASAARGTAAAQDNKEGGLRLALMSAQRQRKLVIVGAVLAMMEDVPLGSINLLFILGQFKRCMAVPTKSAACDSFQRDFVILLLNLVLSGFTLGAMPLPRPCARRAFASCT